MEKGRARSQGRCPQLQPTHDPFRDPGMLSQPCLNGTLRGRTVQFRCLMTGGNERCGRGSPPWALDFEREVDEELQYGT